jgi:hypothetical protein
MAAADLLSAIYLRLTSAYDRARFAAVCTSWCAAAAWHPRLPALPLLLPYTGYDDQEALTYSPENTSLHICGHPGLIPDVQSCIEICATHFDILQITP